MKLLSADDAREFINQRNQQPLRGIKEALTIKDLGVEVSPEEAEAIEIIAYLKKSGQSRCDKNLWLTKRSVAER